MKIVFLLFALMSFSLNAQCYKGIKVSKEQKAQIKNIGRSHCVVHDSINSNHNNKVKALRSKNSEEHYNLNIIYNKKIDSIESAWNNEVASILTEVQRVLFWKKIEAKRNNYTFIK